MAKNRLLAKMVCRQWLHTALQASATCSGNIRCRKQVLQASRCKQWLYTVLQEGAISSRYIRRYKQWQSASRCKQVCNVTAHVASSFSAAAQDNIRPCNA